MDDGLDYSQYETGRLLLAKDFKKTLGMDLKELPGTLKTVISLCLSSRFPMVIFLGPNFVKVYNDAYIPILTGGRHPRFFGEPAKECWSEIWFIIGPMLENVFSSGKATYVQDELLPIYNYDLKLTEERYFTFSYSPIHVGNTIEGIYTSVIETTNQVIDERQLQTLRDVSSCAAKVSTIQEAFESVTNALKSNTTDLPFVLSYLVDSESKTLKLINASGIEGGLKVSPKVVAFSSQDAIESNLIGVVKNKQRRGVDISSLNVPNCGRWDVPVKQCKIVPVSFDNGKEVNALFVLGLNQYRVIGDKLRIFVELLSSQIVSTFSCAHSREQERRKVEMLAEIDRAKTIFFSNVSHEFRTPLTLMLGPLEELISHQRFPAMEEVQLSMIHRNALRLLKLVNTLLDFSRIEAGRIQSVYEPVDISEFTIDVVSVFRSACERVGLNLIVKCEKIDAPVFVDKDKWEKIVLNLVSNSFKFTFQGSVTVSLNLSDDRRYVFLSVQDTGTGIPEHEIPKLFERFHRVHGSRSRTHEGTGIGLALTHELVKLHGGTISVTSVVNQGSCFTVKIPTGNDHLPPGQVLLEPLSNIDNGNSSYSKTASWWIPSLPQLTAPRDPQEVSSNCQNRRYSLLVVDDNSDMRDYLQHLLTPHYDVQVASDGQEALDKIRKSFPNFPDLILTDVMMPNLDGFGFIKELRKDNLTNSIPVIILSARAGEESKVEGLEQGADDYLIKPFTAREVLARINSHLKLAETRLQATKQEKALREQTEIALKAKDHFLAVLSHELRTPLTPALLICESILSDGSLSPHLRSEITTIHRNIQLEVQLIDDLLDLTKIVKGKLILNRNTVSVHSLISQTIGILDHDIKEKSHLVEVSLKAENDRVSADAPRLQQVLWNIIKNAVKFTGLKGNIKISTQNSLSKQNKQFIEISVSDNGIGMTPQSLSKLFQPFEQGDDNITHRFGGLGLGLSVSKRLTEMHDGSLDASSDGIDMGSVFTVTLPTVTEVPKAEHERKSSIEKMSLELRILLVEDNLSTLAILQNLLKKLGHKVTTASSVNEGIEKASEVFDLLISDMGLPDGSGIDLLMHLKKNCRHSFKAIALSGYGMEDDIKRSAEAGFQLHLTKPIQVATLHNAMAQIYSMQ